MGGKWRRKRVTRESQRKENFLVSDAASCVEDIGKCDWNSEKNQKVFVFSASIGGESGLENSKKLFFRFKINLSRFFSRFLSGLLAICGPTDFPLRAKTKMSSVGFSHFDPVVFSVVRGKKALKVCTPWGMKNLYGQWKEDSLCCFSSLKQVVTAISCTANTKTRFQVLVATFEHFQVFRFLLPYPLRPLSVSTNSSFSCLFFFAKSCQKGPTSSCFLSKRAFCA